MIILLIIILLVSVFNALSLVILGTTVARNTEAINNMASFTTGMPPEKKLTGGFRMSPEENLLEVEKTEFPFKNS